MSDVRAYLPDLPASIVTPRAAVARPAADVSVETVDAVALPELRTAWNDLLLHADAHNVFMDPALLRALGNSDPAKPCRVLLAWKPAGAMRQLVGVWGFSVARPPRSILPLRVLTSPASVHNYLATPVVDRRCLDETLDAMLDGIAADPQLSKIVALDMMATDGETWHALMRVLERRGSAPCIVEQQQRPKLASQLDGKAYLEQALSSSTRKKLRQYRRRLSEKGALTSVAASAPADVVGALEEFLTMEAAGWKGREGTALLNDASDAALMREAVGALAKLGAVSIHALRLDGRPVSMQIIARADATAFTWKTTYDEAFQEYSPGMLLLEDYTTALLADKTLISVDSCSFDASGYMSAWQQRQPIAELWIDARRGGSVTFQCLSRMHKSYRQLRSSAKAARLAWKSRRQSRKP